MKTQEATQEEQDAQAQVNQGEGDLQRNGQSLQTSPVAASTAAIGQELNAWEKEVEADLKQADLQEDKAQRTRLE